VSHLVAVRYIHLLRIKAC